MEVATELYNHNGVSNVSSRRIAAELGISHGNLEYHFKTKEILILAIFKEMSGAFSEFYPKENDTPLSLKHFHMLLVSIQGIQKRYSFLMNDLLEVIRKYPSVNKHVEAGTTLRMKQVRQYFDDFLGQGYLKPEALPGYYLRLQHSIRILITFWLPQNEILACFKFEHHNEMTSHIWELLFPNLTDEGLAVYKATIQS